MFSICQTGSALLFYVRATRQMIVTTKNCIQIQRWKVNKLINVSDVRTGFRMFLDEEGFHVCSVSIEQAAPRRKQDSHYHRCKFKTQTERNFGFEMYINFFLVQNDAFPFQRLNPKNWCDHSLRTPRVTVCSIKSVLGTMPKMKSTLFICHPVRYLGQSCFSLAMLQNYF